MAWFHVPASLHQSADDIASALPQDLDALPRLNGFRLRGIEPTRLETFIDAAFAFAITLMVIVTGDVPRDMGVLLSAFRNVPAFIASVLVLGIFWQGHWLWSRRYGLEDGVSILISWGLIMTVLIYVYPLRALFSSMFYFLSRHWAGQLLTARSWGQVRALFAVYAGGFAAIALSIWLLNWRAWCLRDALRLNARERLLTRRELGGWSLPVTVGLVSLVLAWLLPVRYVAWSGWVYFSLALLVPMHRRRTRAKVREMERGI